MADRIADTLTGTNEADFLHGQRRDDALVGQVGDGVLWGVSGNDQAEGDDDRPLFERQIGPRECARCLAAVAERIGRTREAVYKRAQRINARSKQPAYFGRKGKAR